MKITRGEGEIKLGVIGVEMVGEPGRAEQMGQGGGVHVEENGTENRSLRDAGGKSGGGRLEGPNLNGLGPAGQERVDERESRGGNSKVEGQACEKDGVINGVKGGREVKEDEGRDRLFVHG